MKGRSLPKKQGKRTSDEARLARRRHRTAAWQCEQMKRLRAGEIVELVTIPMDLGRRHTVRVRPLTRDEIDGDTRGAIVVAIAGGKVREGVAIDKDGRCFHAGGRDYHVAEIIGVVEQKGNDP